MREINKIIIHCSASDNPKDDSLPRIHFLHTMPENVPIKWGEYYTHGKNFSDIGYQYIITKDGKLHKGRPIEIPGAHCKGHNKDSIGICLTGNKHFSKAQFQTRDELVRALLKEHDIHYNKVYPHRYFNRNKTCPNFELPDYYVGSLDEKLSYDDQFFKES